jgi:SAM-dependent methyltransferase
MEMGGPPYATEVQLSEAVTVTPPRVLERYRENRHWKLYAKEWIYRNLPPAGTAWLDFGCGTGEITTQLALLGATRVIALDVTPGLLDITQQRAELDGVADRVRTLCGDITAWVPEPVDFVLAYAVLHHVPDRLEEILGAVLRWLKPAGTLVFYEPVGYLPMLEWLRSHSGVSQEALDPGERKLTERDLKIIERHFRSCERIHFNMLSRFGRIIPPADRSLRGIDAALRHIPGSQCFAGTVLGICRK